MKLKTKRLLTLLSTIFVLTVAYSNCTGKKLPFEALESKSNGDYYTGKPDFYSHFAETKCTTLGKDGEPLPNRQIFAANGAYQLVRDNCADLATPIALAASDVQVSGSVLIYQGQNFSTDQNFANYDLMPTRCPAGYNGYNASAPNLLAEPYDFTAEIWNRLHPITPILDGAIGALPRYLIQVTSTNPSDWFDWRKASQPVIIEPNTSYAVRYILRSGSRTSAAIQYFEGNNTGWAATVDLQSGTFAVRNVMGPLSNPTGVVEPYAFGSPGSWIVTVFFTSSATGTGTDLGVAPAGTDAQGSVQPGFSIFATAADLRKVADYCVP